MEYQPPARNIMQISQYKDAEAYRIACDCHHPSHDASMWLEVDYDREFDHITLTFYVDTVIPWYQRGFNRFRAMWALLTKGYMPTEHTLILDQQSAQNLSGIIDNFINKQTKQ